MTSKPDYRDQLDLFDPQKFGWNINIIGIGGIGNPVALALAKMGVRNIHVWDDDVAEPHNIPAQLTCRAADVGLPKVEAMRSFFEYMGFAHVLTTHQERVAAGTLLDGVVISGVDSMSSRFAIWDAIKDNPMVPLYVDGRIGSREFAMFALDPSDLDSVHQYESTLFPDETAAPLACATRTTIHTPLVLCGLIVETVQRFARSESYAANIRGHLQTAQLFAF